MKTFILTFASLIVLIIINFPILWIAISSFKTRDDLLTIVFKPFFKPTLGNFIDLISYFDFLDYLRNSLIIASSSTIIVLILSILGGYALARLKFKGKETLAFWILSIRMLPPWIAGIAMYIIAAKLGFLNTLFIVIVMHSVINLPLGIWLMTGYIASIPKEIEEGAIIDGCEPIQIIRYIVTPLAAPGIAAVAILSFLFSWNEFIFGFLLTYTKAARPVTVLATQLMTEFEIHWGPILSLGTTLLIPAIIFAIFAQKYIVSGLTLGAVRG